MHRYAGQILLLPFLELRLKEGLSVRGLTRKLITTSFISLMIVISSISHAGVNPFKKSKDLLFGTDVPWYENAGAVIKSGAERDGSDTNYYHVNIDKHRLLLRLGKNDPSGELVNTRYLDTLAIVDVLADGSRLPIFDWCLNNQQNLTRTLQQNAVVVNDTCINAGGGGDFVINLDPQAKKALKSAKVLSFVIEPYGRPLKLSYSMDGFTELMAKVERPVVIARPAVASAPVVKAPPKPKPVAKPAKTKPVKMCYANAPADFKSAVPAIAYPCKDAAKKADAESKITARVKNEKKKMALELERAKQEELARQKAIETNKRAQEWEAQQDAIWIKRCQRHWKKGTSPCYCEKYLDQAPVGVSNTCGQ